MLWYIVLGLLAIAGLLVKQFTHGPHDKSEPPLIPSRIPGIGHLLGILRHGALYYSEIR